MDDNRLFKTNIAQPKDSVAKAVNELASALTKTTMQLKGDKGETGSQGPKGEKGDKGDKGDQGPQGKQGLKGDKGDQGLKGDTGAIGAQGPKGDKGDKGDQGLKGDKGDKGERGLQGPKGDKGERGERGYSGQGGQRGIPGKGVPDGGTTGQALKKASNADYDTTWDNVVTEVTATGNDGISTNVVNGTTTPAITLGLTDITPDSVTTDYIDLNLTPDPAVTQAEGRMYWNNNDGTVNIGMPGSGGVNLQVGQELFLRARNTTGSTVTNGQVVYINGSSGNRPTIALADASTAATSDGVIGLATEDITNNQNGYVTVFGLVRDIDTSAFDDGDVLYLSETAGALTNVEPVSPAHAVRVGECVNSHASVGVVLVNVNTGEHLGDLHDVNLSSVTDGQALVYNDTSGLWENSSISSVVSDTRRNLLTTTPDNNTLAYATDTKQFYIYNNKWFAISNITGVPNERTSSQINAGVFQSSSETSGYSSKYISGKGISNSSIGGFDDTNYAVKNGAIRYNDISKQFQVYIDEWKALRALSPSEVVNITVYTALRQKDGKGRFMVQHGYINAGALASSYLIDGGSF